LSVGCGAGADATHLRSLGAETITGVEPVSWAAEAARTAYDEVFGGPIEAYPWGDTKFDLIVFADVLEHLVDPGFALRAARDHLSGEGSCLISVPNVRHASVLWELAFRGDWRYREAGILDSTHLRFFTSRSFRRLLEDSGFEVVAFGWSGQMRTTWRIARAVPSVGELLLSQMFFAARPR